MDVFADTNDVPRTITLNDEDDTALDTGNFLTIEVKLRHRYQGTLIGTYTLADSEVTQETPTTGGQVTVIVPTEDIENKPVGVLDFHVKTTETNANYPDSVRTRTMVPKECFKLVRDL